MFYICVAFYEMIAYDCFIKFCGGDEMKQKIVGYRKMCGLSQKKMSEELGISVQAYRNKESGKTQFTSGEMQKFKSLVEKVLPSVTLEGIFFN